MGLTSDLLWNPIVGNVIFNLQNQFPETKIILNSITFCLLVQKLRNNKQAHQLVQGFPMVLKVEQHLPFFFFSFRVIGDEHYWDEKRGGRLSNNRPYG